MLIREVMLAGHLGFNIRDIEHPATAQARGFRGCWMNVVGVARTDKLQTVPVVNLIDRVGVQCQAAQSSSSKPPAKR